LTYVKNADDVVIFQNKQIKYSGKYGDASYGIIGFEDSLIGDLGLSRLNELSLQQAAWYHVGS
jgi:hypothetical protein